MEFLEIEVLNWKRHQRKDVKKPSWLAVDNRILEDSKLFSLNPSEWKAFIYILCQASQQHTSPVVRLDLSHAERVCEIKKVTLLSALKKLEHANVTRTLRERHANATDTSLHRTGQDKTRQDTESKDSVCTVANIAPLPTASDGLPLILAKEVLGLYDPSFLSREAVKAWAWCNANKSKAPKSLKGWQRFFGGWLERGWERHRKSLPSNQVSTPGIDVSRYKNPEDGGAA